MLWQVIRAKINYVSICIRYMHTTCMLIFIVPIHLGMFYYTIANLRPELRSTHRCIRLIAVVTSPLLQKYGFGKILKPFISDVNKLNRVRYV